MLNLDESRQVNSHHDWSRVALVLWLLFAGWSSDIIGQDQAKPDTAANQAAAEAIAESSPDALVAYQDAANFQNNGAFDLAVEAWQSFLQKYGDDPKAIEARFNLGVCHQQLKEYEQAVKYLGEVTKSDVEFDRREEAYLNLGWALYSDGLRKKPERFAEANRVFSELIEKYPAGKFRDQALFFQGESFYMQGKRAEAAAAYQRVVDDFPESSLRSDSMYALGVSNEELGRFPEAGKIYDTFLSSFADNPLVTEVKMRKAETVLRAGDFADAERRFAEVAATKDFPSADHARFRQGFCIAQQERFKYAGELFGSIVRDFPKSQYAEQAAMAAGRSFFRAKELALAAQWFEKILSGDSPFAPEAAHWRARMFLDQGDPAQALGVVRKHLAGSEQNPFFVNLLMDEADAQYEIAAERDQALKNYLRIATDYPDHVLAAQALYNAAFGALERKQPAEGLTLANRFLQKFPKHRLIPDVKHVAAECELQLGNNESAEKLFQDVANTSPDSDTMGVIVRQALAMYMEKKYQPAIDVLNERAGQLKQPAERAEALYVQGLCHLGLDQFKEAESALSQALRTKPDFAQADELLLNLAKAQRKLNRIDDALASVRKIISEFPNSGMRDRAFFRIGEYSYAKQDYKAAADAYSQVIGLGRGGDLVAYALYGRGWSELNQERRDAAEASFTQLITDHAEHRLASQARYARATCYQRSGRFDAALADLDEYLQGERSDHEKADGLYLRALCQIGLKKPNDAAATFRSILNDHPQFNATDKVLYELGWAYKTLKRDSDAIVSFKRLATDFPKSGLAAEALYHVAEQDYNESRFDSALRNYQLAAQRVGENAELGQKILYKLGWSHYQLKDYSQAIVAFDQQVARYPNQNLRNDGVFMKAECLFKQAKYSEAWAAFQPVKDQPLADDQIAALVLLHGGQSAGQIKKWEESIRWLEQLIQKSPNSPYVPTALYEQAWAYQNTGRVNEAMKLYTTVTDRNRGEVGARARFMMGEILYSERKYEQAIREFQKVMFGYGAEKSPPEIKRWQAKSGFEAGQCAGLLASQQQNQTARVRYVDAAKKFFEYVVSIHPQSKEAAAADEQLKKYASRS